MTAAIRADCLTALVSLAMVAGAGAAPAPSGQSLQQMQAACGRGDMAACVRAGRAYEDGEGTAVDKAAAVNLYRRACDGKDGDGCARLGWLYFSGEGVTRDFDAGYALLEKGCDGLRSGEACYVMSVVNLGSDSPGLQDLGSKNLMAACAYGYAEGCYELGSSFLDGSNGFERDAAAAVVIWEQEACNKGHARACAAAGFEYEFNEEVKRDPVKAVALYRKACDAKDPFGCSFLGLAQAEGVGGLARDPAKAAQLYAFACEADVGTACSLLSEAYRSGSGVARDIAKADVLARKGCELKSPRCGRTAAGGVAAAPAAGFRIVRMQLGVDTVASVERDIKARGGTPLTGGSGGAAGFRFNALSGDYRDGGPDIMAVNYDFDAAGPAGRLIAVTIVRMRPVNAGPAPYASLVAERQAAIAQDLGPLQQKSPTEFTATAAGTQATLHVNADTGYLYETFRLVEP
jgi:TPR repeat protein